MEAVTPQAPSPAVAAPTARAAPGGWAGGPALVSVASVVVLLGVWYLVTETRLVDRRFLVHPVDLVNQLGVLLTRGYMNTPLYVHFFASLSRTLTGYVLATLVAIPLGLVMGMNPFVRAAFAPLFAVLRPIPSIAYIPLVILWLGIGEPSKVLVIFLASFLYIVLNTTAGVATVSEGLKRAAANLGASPYQMFRYVIFPAALPSIFTGLKTGLAVSWAVVVAAELIAAQQGLGYMIMDAATFFRIPDVWIGVLLIGLIGLALATILDVVERRVVHWAGK